MVNAGRNLSHLVLFGLIRDGQMLRSLSREIFPGRAHLLLDAHRMATEKKHGYLLLDLHPYCDVKHRMRTDILSVNFLTL